MDKRNLSITIVGVERPVPLEVIAIIEKMRGDGGASGAPLVDLDSFAGYAEDDED